MPWEDLTDGPTFYTRVVTSAGLVRVPSAIIKADILKKWAGCRVMVVDGYPVRIAIHEYRPHQPVGKRTGHNILDLDVSGLDGKLQHAQSGYPPVHVSAEITYNPLHGDPIVFRWEPYSGEQECEDVS